MADLGSLIGTIMTSLVKARRIADEETAKVAEIYKNNPLLSGLTVPRVRVPEFRIDLPVMIKSHEAGVMSKLAEPDFICKEIREELVTSAREEKITFSGRFITRFIRYLKKGLLLIIENNQDFHRESVIRLIDEAFDKTIKSTEPIILPPDKRNKILTHLRNRAGMVALEIAGTSPLIEASVLTSEVKEQSNPMAGSRIQIVLKEEGLEWTVTETQPGITKRSLTPE